MSIGTENNPLRAEGRNYTFQENVGFSLNWVALQCLKPMHYASELFIHSYFTPIRPGEFGNLSTETLEKVSRAFKFVFCVISCPVAIVGLALSYALDSLGDYMTQKSYMRLIGNAEEKEETPTFISENTKPVDRFMTLNACMLWGGLPILFGGVKPARERIDPMAELVLAQNSDVVVMQEASFESGLFLWDKLKHAYAQGFTRIGPMPGLALDSGLFIASKFPIVKEPVFHPLPSNKLIQRGVFYFETEKRAVFVTHLEDGDEPEDAAMRKVQIAEIAKIMKNTQKETNKQCLLLGDLNIQLKHATDDEYMTSGISSHFVNDAIPVDVTEETSTCTNRLTAYAKGGEVEGDPFKHVDYALRLRTIFGSHLSVEQVPTYDLSQPDKALSDHKGLLVLA
jgi:endonuclease/exonuclease/phosphatase family metal-dependent hydrolase